MLNWPWRLSWRSCSLCSDLQSSFWPSAHLCPSEQNKCYFIIKRRVFQNIFIKLTSHTYLFIFTVIPPELFNINHGIDTAPLVHASDGRDALILCVWPHGLTTRHKQRSLQMFCILSNCLNDILRIYTLYSHSFEEIDVIHPNLKEQTSREYLTKPQEKFKINELTEFSPDRTWSPCQSYPKQNHKPAPSFPWQKAAHVSHILL